MFIVVILIIMEKIYQFNMSWQNRIQPLTVIGIEVLGLAWKWVQAFNQKRLNPKSHVESDGKHTQRKSRKDSIKM